MRRPDPLPIRPPQPQKTVAVLQNISLLYTCRNEGGQNGLHPIDDATLVWRDRTIAWVGRRSNVPAEFRSDDVFDASGLIVVPGLIDCHTHLAFGGWRADEFVMRCRGKTYQDIAASGGGILRTVRETRDASEDHLVARASGFVNEMIRLGITTVECKSGYGLSLDEELKLLRVCRRLNTEMPVEIAPTLLAAHAVPPEQTRERYVDQICKEIIPAAAAEHLAEFCDVFVEDGAFSIDEARRILITGRDHGLEPKLHADQLSESGGAMLAAELKAVSADHLEHASRDGLAAMAANGVVAVSLPLATLYLRQKAFSAADFCEAGLSIAVATDFNPGSAPSFHLPLAMTLACLLSSMTPEEALRGATINAARALRRADRIGSLEPGKRADFAIIDAPSVDHWLYHFKPNAVLATFASGRPIYQRERNH